MLVCYFGIRLLDYRVPQTPEKASGGKTKEKLVTKLITLETPKRIRINKIQRDAGVCRCLFTAKLLYMFRVSIAPIIRSTSNCNCSFWYRS